MNDEANTPAQETTEAGGAESTLAGVDTAAAEETPKDETNTETGTSDAETKAEEGEASKEGEATEYADFQMQDGFELDEAALGDAIPVFQEMGLSQDQAQGMIDLYSKMQGGVLSDAVTQQAEQVDAWTKQIKTEWGGEEGFNTKLQEAAKGVDYGDKMLRALLPEDQQFVTVETNGKEERVPATPFRDALNETGAGNHPAIIKFVHSVAQMLNEDGVPQSARGSSQPKDTASRWYGSKTS